MLTIKSLSKLLLTVVMAGFAMGAMAEGREFPASAKRAVLSVSKLGDMLIDGKLRETTPATRVFNEDGLIVTSSNLDSVDAPILYTESEFGEIQRIWLLNAQEAIQYKVKRK